MSRPARNIRSPEQIAKDRAAVLALADGTMTCREMSRILGRRPEEVAPDIYALRRQGHEVPTRVIARLLENGGAVYRHFDADGRLLYVGCAHDPVRRFTCHIARASWYRQITRIEVEWFDGRDAALAAELKAIRTENPVHNVRGREDLIARSVA